MRAARRSLPRPPDPFTPAVSVLRAGTRLYRVHDNAFTVAQFNPGVGGPSRFAFFGDPVVPVLYTAMSEEAAVAETLLRDVPATGGVLSHGDYARRVMGRLTVQRDLRLAALHGLGLRRLGVTDTDVVDVHGPGVYAQTVHWARAAHAAGYDGLEWMSSRCNNTQAQVIFGDRAGDALAQDPTFGRVLAVGTDFDWLVDLCAPLRVDVMPPS